MKKYIAEMIGTMVLVLMGCGSAVIAGGAAEAVGSGVGTLGVAIAFGLSVVAMAYAIGGISGCHINPAITLGVLLAGRIKANEAVLYMLFQVIGALLGSFILLSISSGMGLSGYGANSFAEGNLIPAFIAETVFTFIFVLVVLGATSKKIPRRIWWTGNRTYFGFNPHCVYSNNRDFRKSGTKYRSGFSWRRNRINAVMAFHCCTFYRSSHLRHCLEILRKQ